MTNSPGISRSNRISDEGLLRLEKQLASGARMRPEILAQWVKRYGAAAEAVIKKQLGDDWSANWD